MSNILNIQIVNSPEEAPHYARDHVDIRSATITKAIIVLKGTVNGNSTVDFQFESQDGAKFVAMLTGTLVKQLAAAVTGAESR